MKGKREEAEVIVRIDQQDGAVHVCVCSWPAMFRKLTKLYGPSLDGANPEHSARWKLPLKTFSFRRISTTAKRAGNPFLASRPLLKRQFQDSNQEVGVGSHGDPDWH